MFNTSTSVAELSKFDVDLRFGQEGERWLTLLADDETKLEVKRERDKWYETGNIFFEYERNGKPTGFKVTESEWWAVILTLKGVNHGVLMFRVEHLVPGLLKMLDAGQARTITTSDGRTKGVLVPLAFCGKLMMGN